MIHERVKKPNIEQHWMRLFMSEKDKAEFDLISPGKCFYLNVQLLSAEDARPINTEQIYLDKLSNSERSVNYEVKRRLFPNQAATSNGDGRDSSMASR